MVMKDCMYDTVPISVVMPAYNAEKTIAESIETVLKQTHENLELIIVDDLRLTPQPALSIHMHGRILRFAS